MKELIKKNGKVKFPLVGADGNSFSLMKSFADAAIKQGWGRKDVNKVLVECQSGDRYNLLNTLRKLHNGS